MIYALVVIHNSFCQESETCTSILAQKTNADRIIIFDNSTSDYKIKDYCYFRGWDYLGGKGNQGLSKAYNQAIERLPLNDDDWLCILDDDTTLPNNFFSTLGREIQFQKNVDIFLPILTQAGRILSPWNDAKTRINCFFSNKDDCLHADTKKILAFNSGMAIRLCVFREYRYDERQFLDGIDYTFLRTMRKTDHQIAVRDCCCEQHFSGNDKPKLNAALQRFRIYASDFRVLYEKNISEYIFIVGKRAAHLCLQYRSFDFFLIFFKSLFANPR